MLRRLYDWTMDLAGQRRAMVMLAGVSFIESSVFPIPPDILMIPMVLADRARAFRIAFVCTAASVLGGLATQLLRFELLKGHGFRNLIKGKTAAAFRSCPDSSPVQTSHYIARVVSY